MTASIVTEDISRFWQAYDQAAPSFPPEPFQELYLSPGSKGIEGIIGAEIFALTASTPTHELSRWERSVIKYVDQIPHIVAHELVHFQQPYRDDSLLHQTIIEGSADFIAELTSGKHGNEPIHAFADPRERELWHAFKEVMHGNSFTSWLYDGDAAQGHPADLGYWMGYKITKAYYRKNTKESPRIYPWGRILC
jgi:hypothetical protein